MLKIRRSRNRLIVNMGIPIPGKDILIPGRGPSEHILLTHLTTRFSYDIQNELTPMLN